MSKVTQRHETNDGSRRHPGKGRLHGRYMPKGRAVDPETLCAIRVLLGERPREPLHLIDYLHLIQDHYGCLREDHLAALAAELSLSMAQVYEVATFYSQFVLVQDDGAAPKAVVRVCDGLTCELLGGRGLLDGLSAQCADDVLVLRAPCMGRCDCAPVASVGQRHVPQASVDKVAAVVAAEDFGPLMPDYIDLDGYRGAGGYGLLEQCLSGERSPDELIAILSDANLRGLGGAGYPTGRKWRSILGEPRPRMLVVNFDESEMGTFKDRHLIESDPHRLLEGCLIAGWATAADDAYIYLRDEYHHVRAVLEREIMKLTEAGLCRSTRLHLVRGAGAYICGERSAMLESIEGKRGLPRHKPPRPTQVGLFGRPTLINNAETLFWVRDIVQKGPEWYVEQGRNGRTCPRSFSVSGRVRAPGVKIAPAGITMQQLLEEYCGGMQDGHTFKGYALGGAAGGILPASMADIPLDFDTLEQYGCFIGSAAVVVFSDQDDVRDVVRNLMRFFEDESCGQCTPCRVGTEKAVMLLDEAEWNAALLEDLCEVMARASICGLGTSAPNPMRTALKYFRDELTVRG